MQKKAAIFLIIVFIFSFIPGCTSWSPSNEEAVRLVQDYYLYYYNGKAVEARLLTRGKFSDEFRCYPIDFLIIPLEGTSFQKTFYFFKNKEGKVDVREFEFG